MNNKPILPICLTLMLLATVHANDARAHEVLVNPQGCNTQRVILAVDLYRLEAVPKNPRCARPNEKIVIRIVRTSNDVTIDKGDVTTIGKASNEHPDAWLTGNNTSRRFRITLVVPYDAKPGDYGYEIRVSGVGTLDPVVKVVDNNVFDAARVWDLQYFDETVLAPKTLPEAE